MATTPAPAELSVTAPIQPAIERARRLLFQPFQLARWFPIAFCAWLAHLGEGGYGYAGRLPWNGGGSPWASRPASGPTSGEWWGQARDEVMRNLSWIVPLAVGLVALVLVLALVVTWLSSRGQFMFLHCVALDRSEVQAPWRQYAGRARSLFLFRLALGLLGAVPGLLLLAAIGFLVFQLFRQGGTDPASWLALAAAGLALFVIVLAVVIVGKLTRDLVVPIMFLRGGTCREAWSELLGLFRGRLHLPAIYLLFQLVLGMAIGAGVLIVVVVTCCLAGCILAIPYIGTVALLPVLVFQRSYSAYYLAQLGPRYDVFQPPA